MFVVKRAHWLVKAEDKLFNWLFISKVERVDAISIKIKKNAAVTAKTLTLNKCCLFKPSQSIRL